MNELEYMLQKIIKIDDKAKDIRKRTQDKIDKEQKQQKLQLEDLERKLFSSTQLELQEKKNYETNCAKLEAERIIKEYESLCENYIEKFDRIKDSLGQELIDDLIKID